MEYQEFYVALNLLQLPFSDRVPDRACIKRAYRKLALKYHPDKDPHSGPARFIAVQAAFELLGNEYKTSRFSLYLARQQAAAVCASITHTYFAVPVHLYATLLLGCI